jgi:hypothetical protein
MSRGARGTQLGRRVALLDSDHAADLPRGRSAGERPADGKTVCRACGTAAQLGTAEVCCWWPFGCTTRDDEPYPRLCWDCCSDDERIDLVDIAGCRPAVARIRYP